MGMWQSKGSGPKVAHNPFFGGLKPSTHLLISAISFALKFRKKTWNKCYLCLVIKVCKADNLCLEIKWESIKWLTNTEVLPNMGPGIISRLWLYWLSLRSSCLFKSRILSLAMWVCKCLWTWDIEKKINQYWLWRLTCADIAATETCRILRSLRRHDRIIEGSTDRQTTECTDARTDILVDK